jgi:hypothetical protein
MIGLLSFKKAPEKYFPSFSKEIILSKVDHQSIQFGVFSPFSSTQSSGNIDCTYPYAFIIFILNSVLSEPVNFFNHPMFFSSDNVINA